MADERQTVDLTIKFFKNVEGKIHSKNYQILQKTPGKFARDLHRKKKI